MKLNGRKKIALLLVFILIFAITACTNSLNSSIGQKEGDFEVRDFLPKKQFVFTADLPPLITEHYLDLYKGAGFNNYILIPWASYLAEYSASKEPDETQFASALRLLDDKGLMAFVRGFGTLNSLEMFSELNFSNYPAYKGFYIVDEPGAAEFDYLNDIVVPYWNEYYSNSGYWHLNLFPSYANNALGTVTENGKSAYENYIEMYVDKVLSKVQGDKGIGMDHYALRVKNYNNYISDMYLYDLMTVAQAAKKSGSTLHNCIQTSSGHTSTRIITSSAEVRWQYYTSMAFGASVFESFAYMSDSNLKFECMVGNKINDLYYYSQEVIEEIMGLENAFLSFKWDGVKTFIGSKNDDGYNAAFDIIKKNELNQLNGINSVLSTQDAIIGQFTDENDYAYMITNYTDPIKANLNMVTLKFDNCDKVIVYRSGRQVKYRIEGNTLELPLIGGEGVFVIPIY